MSCYLFAATSPVSLLFIRVISYVLFETVFLFLLILFSKKHLFVFIVRFILKYERFQNVSRRHHASILERESSSFAYSSSYSLDAISISTTASISISWLTRSSILLLQLVFSCMACLFPFSLKGLTKLYISLRSYQNYWCSQPWRDSALAHISIVQIVIEIAYFKACRICSRNLFIMMRMIPPILHLRPNKITKERNRCSPLIFHVTFYYAAVFNHLISYIYLRWYL